MLKKDQLKYIAEAVNEPYRVEARKNDFWRFLIFNGKIKEIVKETISKEFKKPETIYELYARLVPLNVLKKIVTKLAGVYIESPVRTSSDQNELDEEFIADLEETMALDVRMKEANRYFKLFKRNLMQIYIDNGKPQVRNLPRHTYEVFSMSGTTPNKVDVVCVILQDSKEKDEQRLAIWDNDSYFIVNGKGDVQQKEMNALNNPKGVNPYKILPFVYTNEASYSVDPIQNDDLLWMSIVIPVLLTDLLFALKYQAWSIIYTVGLSEGDIPLNPNSVINLDYGPSGETPKIDTIKPEMDSDKMLTVVNSLVAMLLSTNNLSVGSVKGESSIGNAVSGVSKMLDSAESIEDKYDQQAYFYQAEIELWNKISKNMIPYWRMNNLLAPKYNREFSPVFEVSIVFREPKAVITEKDRIESAILKLNNGLASKELALREIYPDYTEDQIADLMLEINEESQVSMINKEVNGEAIQS